MRNTLWANFIDSPPCLTEQVNWICKREDEYNKTYNKTIVLHMKQQQVYNIIMLYYYLVNNTVKMDKKLLM